MCNRYGYSLAIKSGWHMGRYYKPERRRVSHLKYIAKPETAQKLRAREQCAYAVRIGKLTRLPCQKCGAEKSEAHHEDYSKALEVLWLCKKRHAGEHFKVLKTHCIHGHAFTEDNVRIIQGSVRRCRQCHRERNRKYKRRKPEGDRSCNAHF